MPCHNAIFVITIRKSLIQPFLYPKNAMKIFTYNNSQKIPEQNIVLNLHIVAKKNENNSLINGIVKKRRSQKLKQPCIEERSDELAGTGAILARAFFYATQQINNWIFVLFCPQIFKSYNIVLAGIFMQISCKYFQDVL